MVRTCLLLCLVILPALPSKSIAATLDEVMEKHIEAMGGLDNIERVRSSETVATVKMAGMEGTATIYYKYPDKYRYDVDLPMAKMARIASGSEFWMIDMNGQVRKMSGEESQEMISSVFLASGEYLKPEYRGSAVRLIGVDEAEGTTYYKVLLQPNGGRESTLFMDTETHLIAFSEFTLQMFTVRAWQEDYREIDGVMVPFLMRESTGLAALDAEIVVTSYVFNAALDDSLFDRPGQRQPDYLITGGESAEMKFSLRSFHIYIPVIVNGSGPYSFILDSGAGLTVVGSDIARVLNLDRVGELPALGTGGVDVGSFVNLDSIGISDVVIADIVAGELDLSDLNRFALQPIDGILGYDLFSRFVVQVDYQDSLLTLFLPNDPSVPGGADTLAIELEQNHPMVTAVINDSITGRFRIDTGSMNYLDLYAHIVELYGLIDESRSTVSNVRIHGLGGQTIESTLGRINSFTLGELTVRDLPCGFSNADSGLFAVEGIDGNIGGGLLSKFTCTFDYPQGKFYLTPNPGFYEREEMISAGVVAGKLNGKIVVSQVLAGSSAEENGVLVGDVIAAIEGEPVSGMELYQVHELLNSRESNKVELDLISFGTARTVVLDKHSLF
jgi:outer membrane lipoprotein-sorting protein